MFSFAVNVRMMRVSCVIDAQFFIENGTPAVRELAVVTEERVCSFQIETNLKNCSNRDRVTNWFIKRILTGLSYKPRRYFVKQNKVKQFIRWLVYKIKSDFPVGIRNVQLGLLLKEIGLPYVEIDCACANELWACSFHEFSAPNCALKKACHLRSHVSLS